MIVCLYGAEAGPFVEPVARDLAEGARRLGAEAEAATVAAVGAEPWRHRVATHVYVLPFETPPALAARLPGGAEVVSALFPRAEVVNSCRTHDACWDKLTTARRLLARGVPLPDTLISEDPAEARAFVATHQSAVLKEPRSCGGSGHFVVSLDEEGELAGEGRGRRYRLELVDAAVPPRLADGVLTWPAPFFLQRLVASSGRKGVLSPAQILRAYLVDGQIVLWTERYRERVRRPSDFIVNVGLGAKYRFLHTASDEAVKVALRAAEVMDVRIGVVDLIRTGSEGPYVLEVDTDGEHMLIDRSFKQLPEFRSAFDFDRSIAQALVAPAEPPRVHTHGLR